jgi:hypothetical protein
LVIICIIEKISIRRSTVNQIHERQRICSFNLIIAVYVCG